MFHLNDDREFAGGAGFGVVVGGRAVFLFLDIRLA